MQTEFAILLTPGHSSTFDGFRLIAALHPLNLKGEVLEWLKRHAWKACSRQNWLAGSNPVLSAKILFTMKRLIILFSMIGLLAIPQAVEAQTNLVKDSVAMVDSLASADSIVSDAMLVDDADIWPWHWCWDWPSVLSVSSI